VRYGDKNVPASAIFVDFLRDAPPVHAKNLYNLYVYFWRWALWKVFENGPDGIVSFITAASYLRGPGFAGMRKFMRATLDELWILDVGGEGRGARRSENVFAIQTPVAIAIAVRRGARISDEPATVWYARIDGTQEEKYAALDAIEHFDGVEWRECFDGWTEPFLPRAKGDFFSWPLLTDLFPWQHTGVEMKRTWRIAPDRQTLERRWFALMSATEDERSELFHETRDRKIARTYPPLSPNGEVPPALSSLADSTSAPPTAAYGYRTLDRQFCISDTRLGDFMRPVLWRTANSRQLFLTSLITGLLGSGPAASVTQNIPDRHHFRGSFGGKDVVPLWRDAACDRPNITRGILDELKTAPESLFAYCYALLAAPSYTERFEQELEIPGPHVPLTRNRQLFDAAAGIGRRLIWFHTYGERFVPEGRRAGEVPQGVARCLRPVPEEQDDYPVNHSYDPGREELHVGAGTFAPVSPAVRSFSVSGLDVISSWLDYRMRGGAGKRSSQLDRIRPVVWTAHFTEELLRVLWIIEHTVELGPQLDETLDAVIASELYMASELPTPTEDERRPPA